MLRELAQKEPMFVSAMMYNIAKKMKANESLDDAEANIIAQYKKRFSDFQYDNAVQTDICTFHHRHFPFTGNRTALLR